MIRRPPRSTLFPYTTLFRSHNRHRQHLPGCVTLSTHTLVMMKDLSMEQGPAHVLVVDDEEPIRITMRDLLRRSEEHTSELQSRQYLVCRLLLEKNKLSTACS